MTTTARKYDVKRMRAKLHANRPASPEIEARVTADLKAAGLLAELDVEPAEESRKWRTDVPHRGWDNVTVEALDAPTHTCEMCGQERVRYVHYMSHPYDPTELAVGCVCAGKMEGDPDAARRREANLKNLKKRIASAQRRWGDLSKWRRNRNNNYARFDDGFSATIYQNEKSKAKHPDRPWMLVINGAPGEGPFFGGPYHNPYEAAMDVANALPASHWAAL